MKPADDGSRVAPLFASVWQLVDSNLIFPVKLIPGHEAPMYDLLRDLPPHAGIGIEMGAPNSVYIPADQRPILAPMSVPFPHGASISWGDIPPDKQGLAEAFRDRARWQPDPRPRVRLSQMAPGER